MSASPFRKTDSTTSTSPSPAADGFSAGSRSRQKQSETALGSFSPARLAFFAWPLKLIDEPVSSTGRDGTDGDDREVDG